MSLTPFLSRKTLLIVSTNFEIKDILFGNFCSDDDDSILLNHIVLESKYLIFCSKLSVNHISRLAFY